LAEHVDLEHYEVVTLLEVYAEQPVHCDAAGHYHNEVESYVVYGLHVSMYCGSRPVRVGNGLQWRALCTPFWVYHCLPRCGTKPKSKSSCMRIALPNPTKILARGAKPIGRLGLVYQRLPLCRSGSTPAVCGLYQAPPPGDNNGYYMLLELYVW